MNASSALLGRAPAARRSFSPSRLQLTIGLVVLGLSVRCLGLTTRPLWLDEAYSSWFASRSWHYLWFVVPKFETHPPFYYSILKVWVEVWGNNDLALRSLSVLLGAASIPLVLAAAYEQEKLDPSGRPLLRASIAGFLAVCSPMLVALGQEARPYPLLVFAYALSIFGLLRLMRDFKEHGCGRWSSWIIFALGSELTLWAHALGILYAFSAALALAPAWLSACSSRKGILRGAVIGSSVCLLYLPCFMMIEGRAHDWGTNWLTWSPSMLLQLVTMYSAMRMATIASVIAVVVMLLLSKRAIQYAFTANDWSSDRALAVLWLGPPVLSALISILVEPVFLIRTLAGTLVPAYLATAGVLARTPSSRERMFLTMGLCMMLIPSTLEAALRPAFERWDLVASFLERNVSPKDQVWLYPSDTEFPLARAGARIRAPIRYLPSRFPTLGIAGPIRAGSPATVSLTRNEAMRIAEDPAIAHVQTIWLVTRQSSIFDPQDDMGSALARVRRRGTQEEWGYISVQPFSMRRSL